jgi:tetratricopeptide (TPR) repeat protein
VFQPPLLGREPEWAQLDRRWRQAQGGEREVVFVTGEAGIGKTTLMDAFAMREIDPGATWYGRGQCIEHYGRGEPYLPLFEILGQIAQGPHRPWLIEVLARHAPSWLAQMPALLPDAALEASARPADGMTRERMLRELADAVDVLAGDRPLVFVLEDLHWSDMATLDWLAYVARRRRPAPLLIIGTYRRMEAMATTHPVDSLVRDLLRHELASEVAVGPLSEAGVAAYLGHCCDAGVPLAGLARALHRRTDGNPLFLKLLVDELMRRDLLRKGEAGWEVAGDLDEVGVPAGIRDAIALQIARCAPQQQAVLEAASVAGSAFSAEAVAAAVGEPVETVESRCETLAAQEQFVRRLAPVEWPDGTASAGYGFRHDLYREALYERVPVSRRMRWHRQIGARLEQGYGTQAGDFAPELSEHFVRGRDPVRAIHYLEAAGVQAMARSAHREAASWYERALQMLSQRPPHADARAQAIDLHLALRTALIPLGDTAAIFTHMRAAEALAEQLGDPHRQGRVAAYWTRDCGLAGQHDEAVHHGQRALALIQGDATLGKTTQLYLSYAYCALGSYHDAVTVLHDALRSVDALPPHARLGAALPAVVLRHSLTLALMELGEFEDGLRHGEEAVRLAEAAGHPFSLVQACRSLACLLLRRGEFVRAVPLAERAGATCRDADLPYAVPYTMACLGQAYARVGRTADAVACLEEARTRAVARRADGGYSTWSIVLADGYLSAKDPATAGALAREALATARERRERGIEGHALRLLGRVALEEGVQDVAAARDCYERAIALARDLDMRPLLAHGLQGLGLVQRRTGQRSEATATLARATELYRAMGMEFWVREPR